MKTAVVGLVLLTGAVTVLTSTPPPLHDFFRVLQTFDKFIAAEMSRPDATALCLTARKLELDLANKTCTCEASWKESAEMPLVQVNFTFHGGNFVDELFRPDPQYGDIHVHLLYSDYRTCALTKFRRHGEVCILWISENVRESIPPICHEEFERHCGTQRKTLFPDERCATSTDHAAH